MADDERRVVVNLSMPESALEGFETGLQDSIRVPQGAWSMDDDDLIGTVSHCDTAAEALSDAERFRRTLNWWLHTFPRVQEFTES